MSIRDRLRAAIQRGTDVMLVVDGGEPIVGRVLGVDSGGDLDARPAARLFLPAFGLVEHVDLGRVRRVLLDRWTWPLARRVH